MIVDSHLHLFRDGYGQFAGPSPLGGASDVDAYERLMRDHRIDAGLVICYEDGGIDPANNAYVRELARTRGWIHSLAFLPVHGPPTHGDIEALLASGHAGIALYLPDEAAATALGAWSPEIWRHLSQARAIVSLNARPEATRHMRPLVEQADGCQFLFSHLGLPGRHETMPTPGEAATRLKPLLDLAGCPNVGVKLSGLYAIDPTPPHATARPFIDALLERFGPANLHWGSDFSPGLEFAPFDPQNEARYLDGLDAGERELVMGQGLMRKLRAGGAS